MGMTWELCRAFSQFALMARDRATKLVVQTCPGATDPAHNHWLRRRGHVKPHWAERIATVALGATAPYGHAQSEMNHCAVRLCMPELLKGH